LSAGRIAAQDRVGYFPMEDDEYYADSWASGFDATRNLIGDGGVVRRLAGGHDRLLTDAPGVLHDVDHAFARGHIGQPFVGPLT
ncbi:MAG: hypothetical protein ACREJM_15035, partial [Candidatus Saccharimonadales bacterium]